MGQVMANLEKNGADHGISTVTGGPIGPQCGWLPKHHAMPDQAPEAQKGTSCLSHTSSRRHFPLSHSLSLSTSRPLIPAYDLSLLAAAADTLPLQSRIYRLCFNSGPPTKNLSIPFAGRLTDKGAFPKFPFSIACHPPERARAHARERVLRILDNDPNLLPP